MLFNGSASAGLADGPRVSGDYGSDAIAAPKNSKKVAKAWAVGLLADDAARAVAWLVGGGLLVLLLMEGPALGAAVQANRLHITMGFLHQIASIVSLVTVAIAGLLVGLLRRLLQSLKAEDHRRAAGRGDVLAAGRAPVRPAVLRRARDTRSRRPGPAAHGPERIRPGPARPAGELRNLLSHHDRKYWRNAVRRSDYIGSWIFSPLTGADE